MNSHLTIPACPWTHHSWVVKVDVMRTEHWSAFPTHTHVNIPAHTLTDPAHVLYKRNPKCRQVVWQDRSCRSFGLLSIWGDGSGGQCKHFVSHINKALLRFHCTENSPSPLWQKYLCNVFMWDSIVLMGKWLFWVHTRPDFTITLD